MSVSHDSDSSTGGDAGKRRAYLEQLRRILRPVPAWDEWLERTGELPPDFDSLPSRPELPDPLEGVASPGEWPQKRQEILARLKHWVLGSVPPSVENLNVEVVGERVEEGATVRSVLLSFGPERKATLRAELLIPPGEGPFPIFLTQHNHRAWAQIALRRGYLGCVYSGADSQDDTDTFVDAYPEHDWSKLTRRGWAAIPCIDYLETVPQADTARIVISGHSRNGKSSLMAAALDERIGCVISSSSGVGGALPSRYCSEQHFAEGIENITYAFPSWFHPRWRFFVGREDRMPFDLHELVALAAPRACLLSTALNDGVESSWAIEKTYRAMQRVWEYLGAAGNVAVLWRSGAHETWTDTIERYCDWADARFGRDSVLLAERTFYDGPESSGFAPEPPAEPDGWPTEIAAAVRRMLGEAPPGAAYASGSYGFEAAHVAMTMNRATPPAGVEKRQVVFGEYLSGDIYLPAGTDPEAKLPAVLWLHPFSFASGYTPAYRRGEQFQYALAKAGYAVFCFDHIGHGRRIEEGEGFYRRHPRWSLLGKMVRDARAALDSLHTLPYIDPAHIFGVGFGLGSLVGLHLGALDARMAGFATVCGPAPFAAGGIIPWTERYPLLPRLAAFAGNEGDLPYDIPDLLATFAPRPLLAVTPLLDREAPADIMTVAIEALRPTWKSRHNNLQQIAPEDYSHFDPRMQAHVLDWLKRQAG